MAQPTRGADADERAPKPEAGSAPGVPRWVKVLGIIGLLVVVVVVIVMLLSGGRHGPGQHISQSDSQLTELSSTRRP